MGWKSGAAAGAAAGLWGGPVGVAIGAAIGGVAEALCEGNCEGSSESECEYEFKASIDGCGVHIEGCDICWNDVVSLVLGEDNQCNVTIRGGLVISTTITADEVANYTRFVRDEIGCDNLNFDSSDLSNKNFRRLSEQLKAVEFSEAVSEELRSIKPYALNSGAFLDNLLDVSSNFWNIACNLSESKGNGLDELPWFSALSDILMRNIKIQIAQLKNLCEHFDLDLRDYSSVLGRGLWWLATLSDGGLYVDVNSQKRGYETYYAARCHGYECDGEALSALTADGDDFRPFGDKAWRRERKMIICPALSAESRPDVVRFADGLYVKGVMLMSAEDIENYNESEVGNQFSLVFDVGHPQNGKTYLQHPLQQNRYVDVDDYDFVMLNSKWLELQKLLEHLGAAKMTSKVSSAKMVEEKSRKKKDVGGRVDIPAVGGVSCKTSHERSDSALADLFQEMSGTIKLHPCGKPSIPDGLVFFKAEPGWQQMAESVLAGRMTHVCVDLVYKTETVVSSKQMRSIEAELSSAVPGYQFGIGGSFADDFEKERRERKTQIWHYEVTFADVTPKDGTDVGKGTKLISATPAKKRVTAKSGSRSDGEAMILSRAKRYAKTEDAAKSGMLTDAQKADLAKLASKCGIGELRLEELIDEAFV